MTENRLAVVLPAFNEAKTIAQLCRSLASLAQYVIVVDDGSTDSTTELAQKEGAIVIRHQKRLGKGAALRSGFKRALSLPVNWIATMDADGQHSPEDLESLYKIAFPLDTDLVIGSRSLDSNKMSSVRKATNRCMTAVIQHLTGIRLKDSQSGLRIFRSSCLAQMHLTSSHFEIETETLLEAARLNLRIDFAPISTLKRESGKSHISLVPDTLRWLRLIYLSVADKR